MKDKSALVSAWNLWSKTSSFQLEVLLKLLSIEQIVQDIIKEGARQVRVGFLLLLITDDF